VLRSRSALYLALWNRLQVLHYIHVYDHHSSAPTLSFLPVELRGGRSGFGFPASLAQFDSSLITDRFKSGMQGTKKESTHGEPSFIPGQKQEKICQLKVVSRATRSARSWTSLTAPPGTMPPGPNPHHSISRLTPWGLACARPSHEALRTVSPAESSTPRAIRPNPSSTSMTSPTSLWPR